jgi:hypothetical protein
VGWAKIWVPERKLDQKGSSRGTDHEILIVNWQQKKKKKKKGRPFNEKDGEGAVNIGIGGGSSSREGWNKSQEE